MFWGDTKGGKTTLNMECLSALGPYGSYTSKVALTGDAFGDIKWSPEIFVPIRFAYANDITGALSEDAVRYLTDGGYQPRTLKGITTYTDLATATPGLSFNPETMERLGLTSEAHARRTVPAEFAQLSEDLIDGAVLAETATNTELAEHMLSLIVAEHAQMTFGETWPWGQWVQDLLAQMIEEETKDHMAWLDQFVQEAPEGSGGVHVGLGQRGAVHEVVGHRRQVRQAHSRRGREGDAPSGSPSRPARSRGSRRCSQGTRLPAAKRAPGSREWRRSPWARTGGQYKGRTCHGTATSRWSPEPTWTELGARGREMSREAGAVGGSQRR